MSKTTQTTLGSVVLNLGRVERIPLGEGRSVRIGGLSIAVFRARDGRVFVTDAACSHKGGALADGTIGTRTIVCPLHACGYDLETGAAVGHACGPVKAYPSSVSEGGDILVGVE
jgi:nitrite reductase (NADH) small subunit